MAERRTVVDKTAVDFEGFFSVKDIYKLLDDWFQQHGYDKVELSSSEQVFEAGKDIELFIEPEKKPNDYFKFVIRMVISFAKVKKTEIEIDGKKKILDNGKLSMLVWGFLDSDYKGRWEKKAEFFFLRVLFDKFIYKGYFKKFSGQLQSEVHQLLDEIKAYLGMQKY